jgi:hypothetical protein
MHAESFLRCLATRSSHCPVFASGGTKPLRQVPAPLPPLQVSLGALHPLVVCRPTLTDPQMPLTSPVFTVAHDWHVAEHVGPQQIPSTQLPVLHWLLPVHAWPCAVRVVQLPAPVVPLHASEPVLQSLLVCSPTPTGAQVPFGNAVLPSAHDWQVPVQLGSQQIPSTQLPDGQSPLEVQAEPTCRRVSKTP